MGDNLVRDMGGKSKRNKYGKNSFLYKVKFMIVIFIIAVLLLYTTLKVDKIVFSTISYASETQIKNIITDSINSAMKNSIGTDLSSQNFYELKYESGYAKTLEVNTLLINGICVELSNYLNKELETMDDIIIKIPFSTFLGLDYISSAGPNLSVHLYPKGSTTVDYVTNFEAVGINQINFKVILKVKTDVQMVNPFSNETIIITRDIPLIDTIISGITPDTYFNGAGNYIKQNAQ